MTEPSDDKPFRESHLDSPEYRDRLKRKLNTLIAVLEVASAKVRRSLAGPEPDTKKLLRIKKNLQETLDVCLRARGALEKRGSLNSQLEKDLASAVSPKLIDPGQGFGAGLNADQFAELPPAEQRHAQVPAEVSSAAEAAKFAGLEPIEPAMVWSCDLDELTRKLQS